jgi:hypothetical protein
LNGSCSVAIITSNSLTEYARLHGSNDGLVTIYHSGAVVLDGPADGVAVVQTLLRPLFLLDDIPLPPMQMKLR